MDALSAGSIEIAPPSSPAMASRPALSVTVARLPFTPSRFSARVRTAWKPGSVALMAGNLARFSCPADLTAGVADRRAGRPLAAFRQRAQAGFGSAHGEREQERH